MFRELGKTKKVFNKSFSKTTSSIVALRPQRPNTEYLRWEAQDGHLDFHTASELWTTKLNQMKKRNTRGGALKERERESNLVFHAHRDTKRRRKKRIPPPPPPPISHLEGGEILSFSLSFFQLLMSSCYFFLFCHTSLQDTEKCLHFSFLKEVASGISCDTRYNVAQSIS